MKTHTETTDGREHRYTIRMAGDLDGVNTRDPVGYSPYEQAFEPNVSVRLENLGDTNVVNPWIIVNDSRDWRTLDRILDEILDDGMTDGEKARAIWEFARTHRYHYTCATDEVKDTVKMLNVYGYTLCWDEAYTVSNLWQAAGLKVRRGYPHGHCTTEVWYDDAWHLLDSDEHLMYLLRDNRTIASESDLAADRDLVKRGHAYGVLQREDPAGAEGASSLFFFTGPRTGCRPRVGDHRMELTLRPGESLTWAWEDRGKYHGYWDRPKRLSNGAMQYVPDLDRPEKWAARVDGWVAGPNGLRPESGRRGTLEVDVRCPYVVVGGTVDLTCNLDIPIDVSVARDGADPSALSRTDDGSFDADPAFPSDGPPAYGYTLRIVSPPDTPADFVLSGLSIRTDLQMAPLSLPALEVGENRIRYTSDSGGPVSITHAWTEREGDPAPAPPDAPHFPADGGEVSGTRFTFSWPEVKDAVDYHFQLGESADFRYVLSPVFDKLVSRTPSKGKAEWSIPFDGLLSPHRTYFWRVRARNGEGRWGAWSRAWSFTPKAPGIPLEVDIEADWDDRTLTLGWQPNPEGSVPDHYEIFGSNERGFSASREPYRVMVDNKNAETFPANLVATTDGTEMIVGGPDAPDGGFAFYRVVAVDPDGIRSGPSDLAAAPRPMILSTPALRAVAGVTYTYPVRVTTSIGELRAERVDNRNYVRTFREADELRFLVDEGPPEWVSIDEKTGVFTARPEPKHVGYHTITIRVQNGQGGTDMQGFDLEVIGG